MNKDVNLEPDANDFDVFQEDVTASPENVATMVALLNIQDSLNEKFLGKDWRQRAALHKEIDYVPAILDEAAELLRSYPTWKFWKKNPVCDPSNMKLEYIDILHFALSESLASEPDEDPFNVANAMAVGYEEVYIISPGLQSNELPIFDFQLVKENLMRFISSVTAVYYSEKFIGDTSEDFGGDEDREGVLGLHRVDWNAFWSIAYNLGMSFEEVYATYIGKVALNKLRVLKGDKVGTYTKIWWDGKEDNFFLMQKLEELAGGYVLGSGVELADLPNYMDLWLEETYSTFLRTSSISINPTH
jgi:dimeric dUTPase (all-alpha-NTP-PPase superfamily)